ncbi:uncharacterized protein LOC126852919 isoform X2 [Cataglyphis hispanica]|uniref:uncharacterized protein LOC126852919 isoform X2 n=1 Tax=Cataglyphis hispanica TaxID=1086592 RepID=UPI00217FACD8|nr:uncharacterized protein LOC126852919 isoform X2 [Cataglyphis hispanica]
MDEGEILLLPSFSSNNTMNKERPRKKLWRNAVQVVASDDEDSDGHECTFFPAKRHCSTQLSEVDETRSDTEQHMNANTETTTNNIGNIEMMHPPDPLEEDSVGSRYHLSYRRNDMEDTAVTMAIRNHGLVQSAELALQPHYCKCIGVDCSFSSKCMYELDDFYGTVYSNVETGRCNALDADKIYECDQPEDFLERAVGEAIKKKGLSALSVDYG